MPDTDKPDWREQGSDPDYRFSLANERTFLAWIRTALGFLAGGVAVVQLVPDRALAGAGPLLGMGLALLGMLVAGSAYPRWMGNERSMRMKRSLPRTRVFALLSVALGVMAVIVLVLQAIEALR